jgi:CRP-like cAMP-binding protein
MTQGDFRRVLDENPGVQRKVMEKLAERLLSYSGAADV